MYIGNTQIQKLATEIFIKLAAEIYTKDTDNDTRINELQLASQYSFDAATVFLKANLNRSR